jgi:ABC-type phosphate transport system permease subunit
MTETVEEVVGANSHSPVQESGVKGISLLPTVVVWAIAILVTAVFLWILSDIIWHGAGQLSWEFLTTAPENAGRRGGIGPILVSTLLILGVCMAVSVFSKFLKRRRKL